MADKQYIWVDGKFVDFKEAKVHILTHSLQYGSGVFDRIRAYNRNDKTYVFRLDDHIKRLFNSAKIYAMELGYDQKELKNVVLELIKKNKLESAYIRLFAFYDDQKIGLGVTGKRVGVAISAEPFGNYFENKDKGIRCKVSSWRRISSEVLPPQAKASANYMNSILASEEAKRNGADEAIMLAMDGHVAEGPGENIFLVENGKLITPSESSDILLGITRDSVIKMAESVGIIVEQRQVHREELYTCDELFFTGTAAEITPIINVDGRKVGRGHIGPMTKVLSDFFSDTIDKKNNQFERWLTQV